MRRSTIRRGALALVGSAALGAGAMTGIAATSHATATKGATRAFATGTGEVLTYSVKRLTVPAGTVTLKVTNRGELAHDIALRGKKLAPHKGKIVATGKVSKVVVTLPPGTYTFYCSVFGHEKGGMRGTLTVTAK